MTHKKILTAAIAAALSMGGGIAQATEFTALGPTNLLDGSAGVVTATTNINAGIAYELFNPTVKTDPEGFQKLPGIAAAASCDVIDDAIALPTAKEDCFAVTYKFDTNLKIIKDFTVTYSLKNARFVDNKLPELVVYDDAIFKHAVEIKSSGSLSDPITSFSKVVSAGATEIDNVTNPTHENYLLLKEFQVEVLEKDFAVSGQQVELTINITSEQSAIADTQTIILAKTVAGYTTSEIKPNPATDISEIDIKAVAEAFTPGSVNDVNLAYLGSVEYAAAAGPMGKDMQTAWADNIGTTSAKIENLPQLPSGTEVFVDKTDDKCQSTGANIQAATQLSLIDAEARWDPLTLTSNKAYFCIKLPDPSGVIGENPDPAKLFFTAKHTGGPDANLNGNLGHIKRNGAFCSVYVVTDENMQDESNLRITNLSDQEGAVIGTLRNMQNEEIFSGVEIASIPAQGTIRLSSTDLMALAESNGDPDKWTNRGVISMASTIPAGKMEVFLLLRRKVDAIDPGHGYPLLNMSLGSSGNACQ